MGHNKLLLQMPCWGVFMEGQSKLQLCYMMLKYLLVINDK